MSATTDNSASTNRNDDELLWGYGGVGEYERDLRRLMGVTLNTAVMSDKALQKPGRVWRELDQGGFITLPDWLKQYETGEVRDWKDFKDLLKHYDIEDDDGYEIDENWCRKAVDRLMFEDVFLHGGNTEKVDFIVGSDYIKEQCEDRMIKRVEMSKLEGEDTAAAMKRLYPDEQDDEGVSEKDRYISPPRMSAAFMKEFERR